MQHSGMHNMPAADIINIDSIMLNCHPSIEKAQNASNGSGSTPLIHTYFVCVLLYCAFVLFVFLCPKTGRSVYVWSSRTHIYTYSEVCSKIVTHGPS